jgi:gliding motility-associated-like protein
LTKVSWTEPIITDNCDKVTVVRSHAPGDEFAIGVTTIVYTATDAAGNTSTCQFLVNVATDAAPTITNCPVDIAAEGNENGEVIISWTEPTAATICGSVAVTGSHSPGDRFPIGTTVVSYTATDDRGQTVTCSFNVNVSQSNINIDISKVITPDGNGQNDEWIVTNIEKFRDNKVVIVDRWGSVIYSAAGYDNQNIVWRGLASSGSLAPTGTYFYTFSIRYGSAAIEKTGFIELIR